MRNPLVHLVLLSTLFAWASAAPAAAPLAAPLAAPAVEPKAAVVKKALPAVVTIKGRNSQGAGFLVSSDGKIVTALHVIADLQNATVLLPSGDSYDDIKVLGVDPKKDLAIIKIPGYDLPVLDLGNSNKVSVGESVLLLGHPEGLRGSVTYGIVSSIRDAMDKGGYRVIQTDAATNPGNSGGPLLNAQGQVIGVMSFKMRESENLNFAIPINYIRGMLASPGKPMTLADLRKRLGGDQQEESEEPRNSGSRTTSTAEDSSWLDETVVGLSLSDLKRLIRAQDLVIVNDEVNNGCAFKVGALKARVTIQEGNMLFLMPLADEPSFSRINTYNANHRYGFVFKRTNDKGIVLELDLYIGAGVTRRTIGSYIAYYKGLVNDLSVLAD